MLCGIVFWLIWYLENNILLWIFILFSILLLTGLFLKQFFSFFKNKTMQSEKILHSDVLDIIFEHRNKSYGAYNLRKHYKNRLYKAIAFTIILISAAFAFSFIKTKKTAVLNVGPEIVLGQVSPTEPPKVPEPKMPEKPKDVTVKEKVNTQQFTDHIQIVKIETAVPKLINLNDSSVINNTTETGARPGAKQIVQGGSEVGGNSKTGEESVKPVDNITPTTTAEVMPSYPGGMQALYKFLQKNLRNPQDIDEGQVISVKIKFVVGYDGALKGFETVEDGGNAFNNEVVRVLKKMPEWIPGKSRGQNVSVYYTIPVKFVAE